MDDHPDLPEETVHLVRRFQRGDKAAGDALFARYYPRVLRIVAVRARTWGVHIQEVEDIVQDSFFAATRAIQQCSDPGEGGLRAWLARIATNKVKDHLRRTGRFPDGFPEDPSAGDSTTLNAWQPAASTTAVHLKAARAEGKEFTDFCLARIREDYREAILLRGVAGCEWETVGEKLGLETPEAARKLHSRARAALAAEMRRQRPGYDPS